MEPTTSRKWFKKKQYIIPSVLIAGIIAIASMGEGYLPPIELDRVD